MAIFSPLATRRSNRPKSVATQQLIVFRLQNEGFALPIRVVQKVIPMGKTYGVPGRGGVSLTLYQDRELIVIDVGRRIFKGRALHDSLKSNLLGDASLAPAEIPAEPSEHPLTNEVQRFLLIVQSSSGQLVGVPIEEPPSLQRVPESAFAPLSASYLSEGNLRCVSALIKPNNDEQPLFLLNPDQLVQSEPALPPA
jgi:chemotaxis signal transduction protein